MLLLLLGLETVLLSLSVHLLCETVTLFSSQGLEEAGVIAGLGLPLLPRSPPRGVNDGFFDLRGG